MCPLPFSCTQLPAPRTDHAVTSSSLLLRLLLRLRLLPQLLAVVVAAVTDGNENRKNCWSSLCSSFFFLPLPPSRILYLTQAAILPSCCFFLFPVLASSISASSPAAAANANKFNRCSAPSRRWPSNVVVSAVVVVKLFWSWSPCMRQLHCSAYLVVGGQSSRRCGWALLPTALKVVSARCSGTTPTPSWTTNVRRGETRYGVVRQGKSRLSFGGAQPVGGAAAPSVYVCVCVSSSPHRC